MWVQIIARAHTGVPGGPWTVQLDLDRTPLQFMKVCTLKEPPPPLSLPSVVVPLSLPGRTCLSDRIHMAFLAVTGKVPR